MSANKPKLTGTAVLVWTVAILVNIMPFFIMAGAMIVAHESVGSPVFTIATGVVFFAAYVFLMARNRARRAEIDRILDEKQAERAAAKDAVDGSDKPS